MADIFSKFVATSDIESYFVDKDTGFPLAAGEITFYSDVDRTVLKPVYQLTGTPGAYTYSPLANPMTLSGTGTYQDENGNNIVPFYYPFVGNPEDNNDEIELYYITVTSEQPFLVPQFTRQAWPPGVTTENIVPQSDVKNYIPNGQFLAYNDIVSETNPPVEVVGSVASQPIAQGGWYFNHTNGSSSVFKNKFRNVSQTPVPGLPDFPNAFFQYICQSFDPADDIRDIEIRFPGVYTFSSGDPLGEQPYTYSFAANSLDVNTYQFSVRMIQNFGTGGTPTPPIDTLIQTVDVSTLDTFSVPISGFPATPAVLGTDGNDYVSLVLRAPASICQAEFTDFSLLLGSLVVQVFPTETQAETLSEGVFGSWPKPRTDGWELYLYPVYTLEGIKFDSSEISRIVVNTNISNFTGSISNDSNVLICDGASYFTDDYSPLGIPYARLHSFIFDTDFNLPEYGTGLDYVTAYLPANDTLNFTTNEAGAQTPATEGAVPTGFTFTVDATGSDYGVSAYISNQTAASFYVHGNVIGAVTSAADFDTSFVITQIYNSANTKQLFSVKITSGLPTAGSYWTFSSTTTNYYVWYTVDGVGVDPTPGGTGILIPILSTYNDEDAARLTVQIISGFEVSNIETVAGSLIPAGAYFTFQAGSENYLLWYTVDGAGTAPAVVANLIQCDILSTDTADEVATKTQYSLNRFKFAVPNLQGVILKGGHFDSKTWSPNINNRFSQIQSFDFANGQILTYEWSSNIEHNHQLYEFTNTNNSGGGECINPSTPLAGPFTAFEGAEDAHPFNFTVAYCIKY